MKELKRILTSVLSAALLLTSCQKNELSYSPSEVSVLYATIEEAATRTYMDDNNNIRWSEGDQVVAFMKSSLGLKYQVHPSGVGQTSASFEDASNNGGGLNAGTELDHNVVLYPYSSDAKIERSGSAYALDIILPAEQTYAEESFGNGSMAMVAVSETNNITFRNVLGGIKLQLKGSQAISSITLEGKDNEKLSGAARVTAYTDETKPSIIMDPGASPSVTLDCGTGVQLDQNTATEFIIALPPVVFNKGFIVTVTDSEGKTCTVETDMANSVHRSSLLVMPAITIDCSEGGDDSSSDSDEGRYIVYKGTGKNNNTIISGDSYWNLEPFFYSRVSTISEIELKFQMGPKEANPYDSEDRWLFSSERPYINNGARLSSQGLVLRYNNSGEDVISNERIITWNEMGVPMTGRMVLNISVSRKTVTVNGKEISVPELEPFTNIEYLFSNYYYYNDDGYAKEYAFVPVDSKLYYAKIWDSSGNLVYHGYASQGEKSEGNVQYVWNSKYKDNEYSEFPNTNYKPFWVYQYTASWLPFDGGTDIDDQIPGSIDLSSAGTANSYIVSSAGSYQFTPAKGNSSEPVGSIASAEVLWESFGTDVTPNVGDLVKNAVYSDGCITFQTAETFKKGNAVIAAKDASGTILWSWHIWLTDEPQGQEYYNNAGTMMDRNLGATSATPGDVGALGLLYQWGRKDPFLGSSSISDDVTASATINDHEIVDSDSKTGTISYSIANPTKLIYGNSKNNDWYYTGSSSTDKTRWTTSTSKKSIYDPCPAGWRVPDGGGGVWGKALNSNSDFTYIFATAAKGYNFTRKFGSETQIWYPAAGYRGSFYNASPYGAGSIGCYWSATTATSNARLAYYLYFGESSISLTGSNARSFAKSVRCIQE